MLLGFGIVGELVVQHQSIGIDQTTHQPCIYVSEVMNVPGVLALVGAVQHVSSCTNSGNYR